MIISTFNFNGRCIEAIEFYEKIFTIRNKMVLTYGSVLGVSEDKKDWIFNAKMELEV